MNLSIQEKRSIAEAFLAGLRTKGSTFASIMAENVVWTLPGNGVISGEARGIDGAAMRAQLIVGYGMHFELKHILYGENNVALSLHNSASRGELKFDQDLVTVLSLRSGKIFAVDTYMSDVDQVSAFFTINSSR